mmetsp:Transcript_1591/g.3407  ORF Transcript_1591/g.3407 Transcript_1591/m.3407 type:complete len:144 (+) Transcript_1591:3484-3915(+)
MRRESKTMLRGTFNRTVPGSTASMSSTPMLSSLSSSSCFHRRLSCITTPCSVAQLERSFTFLGDAVMDDENFMHAAANMHNTVSKCDVGFIFLCQWRQESLCGWAGETDVVALSGNSVLPAGISSMNSQVRYEEVSVRDRQAP